MRLRILAIALLTSCIGGLAMLPAGASSKSSTYAQMNKVIADANAERTVHYAAVVIMGSKQVVNNTDTGRDVVRQVITLTDNKKSNTVVIEFVGGIVYVKGDFAILTSYMGFPNSTAKLYANRWFSIPKNSPDYAAVFQGLTLQSTIAELTMTKSITSLASSTLNGRKVGGFQGYSVKSALDPSVGETFYFWATNKPLPLKAVWYVTNTLDQVTFSHWNESFAVTLPTTNLKLKLS
jgi:hypothetical protein